MDGPIAKRATHKADLGIPVGNLDESFQQVPKQLDGNDVRGMLQPLLDAIGELEAEVAWLKARA